MWIPLRLLATYTLESLMKSSKILEGFSSQKQRQTQASCTQVSGKSFQGPIDASNEDVQM